MIVLIGTEVVFLLTMPLFYSGDGDSSFSADTPRGTLLGFAIFGIVLVLFHALVWLVHKRGIETMLGPFKRCWFHYRRTLVLVGILALTIATAPPFLSDADIALRRPFLSWLFFATLAVPIISIQAMTEEVIYRGYLKQQLAAYRPEKWVWIGIPSILFGSAQFQRFWPVGGAFPRHMGRMSWMGLRRPDGYNGRPRSRDWIARGQQPLCYPPRGHRVLADLWPRALSGALR